MQGSIPSHCNSASLPVGSNDKVLLKCNQIMAHFQLFNNKYTKSTLSSYSAPGAGLGNRHVRINETQILPSPSSVLEARMGGGRQACVKAWWETVGPYLASWDPAAQQFHSSALAPVVSNVTACQIHLSLRFLKIPMPGPSSSPIKSEPLGVWPGCEYFLKLPGDSRPCENQG